MVFLGVVAGLATLAVLIYASCKIGALGMWISDRFGGFAFWMAWGLSLVVPAFLFAFITAIAVFCAVSGVSL